MASRRPSSGVAVISEFPGTSSMSVYSSRVAVAPSGGAQRAAAAGSEYFLTKGIIGYRTPRRSRRQAVQRPPATGPDRCVRGSPVEVGGQPLAVPPLDLPTGDRNRRRKQDLLAPQRVEQFRP